MTHRSRRVRSLLATGRRRRITMVATAAGALLLGAAAVAGSTSESPQPCAVDRPLQVTAAPEIAPAIRAVLDVAPLPGADPTCPGPQVQSDDPATTAASMATDAADRPDVWVPDSSMWTTPTMSEGAGLPAGGPSVASSPFVIALRSTESDSPTAPGSRDVPATMADLVSPGSTSAPRWALPDPTGSAAGLASILTLREALGGRSDTAAVLERTLRAADRTNLDLAGLADRDGAPRAVPTTEQRIFTQVQVDPSARIVPAYAVGQSLTADFPFVVLATQRARRLAAADLLEALHSDLGRRLLASHGFRDPAGVPGTLLASLPGVQPDAIPVRIPAAADVAAAVTGLRAVRRPTRILAVIDVSGSMGRAVVGTDGAKRLDRALQGLISGLATYSDDTIAGLWTFATAMTPTTDHRELVPMIELGRGPDGGLGRERLAEALARVRLRPHRRTALYDTVLAAVREVREGWDPRMVNSVVLLTDGADSDRDGISLKGLLRRLRDEQHNGKPVAVFAVGYGPSADNKALRAIARATDGVAYHTSDARSIGSLIADAIGRRACAGQCG